MQVNITETRHKTKMMLELTDDEVVELTELLGAMPVGPQGWARAGYLNQLPRLTPRMQSLLHNLQSGPQETREEAIERGAVTDG